MITSDFFGDIVNAGLRQLGVSSIESIRNGILYIAKFELNDGIKLAYVFNITKKQRYFLQRVLPYPMSYGYFKSPEDIVRFIREDLEKFQNAQNSHNFKQFLDISETFHEASLAWEKLFLERNVSKEAMDELERSVAALLDTIHAAYEGCSEI